MSKTIVFFSSLLLLCFFGSNGFAENSSIQDQTFICDRGVALPAVFLKPQNSPIYVVVSVDGKLVAMREQKTDSGSLYASVDDQDNYQLRIYKNEATLTYKDAGENAKEQIVLSSCQADIAED